MPKTPKHHGFDWPLTLSISRWGRAVINQNQAARELNTLPGPFCSALGPKPPTPENAQFLHPSSSRKKQTNKQKPRSIRGGVVRASTRARSRTSFSPPQRLWEPPCPASAHLTKLRPRHSDAGGPRTRMSEVHWVPGRTEVRRSVPEAEPPPRRPSLHPQEWSTRSTVRKSCGVADSLEERGILAQAPSPPPTRLCPAGGRTGRRTGPRRLGWGSAQDLTPAARSSPRGAALAPTRATCPRWGGRAAPGQAPCYSSLRSSRLEEKSWGWGDARRADRLTCPAT